MNLYSSNQFAKCAQIANWIPIANVICPSLVHRLEWLSCRSGATPLMCCCCCCCWCYFSCSSWTQRTMPSSSARWCDPCNGTHSVCRACRCQSDMEITSSARCDRHVPAAAANHGRPHPSPRRHVQLHHLDPQFQCRLCAHVHVAWQFSA